MASLRQAARTNMQGYSPVPRQPDSQPQKPPEPMTPGRSPNMLAAMPEMASTADAFQRQFYGGSRVPTFRTLPAKRGKQ